MTKTILLALPLAALALAAPAAADGGKHKSRYHGALSGADVQGKAKLFDGKRRDKVSVRLRGLTAGGAYAWELRQAAAGGDACAGEAVEGFTYRALKVRARGKGGAKGKSRAFVAEAGAAYAVVVTGPDGAPVACAELEPKGRRRETEAGKQQKSTALDDDQAGGEESDGADSDSDEEASAEADDSDDAAEDSDDAADESDD